MQVILLEKIDGLGKMGETVTVKPGHARNFLLPKGKALRATKENIAYFEAQHKHLEAENAKKKVEAEKVAAKIKGITVPVVRAASEAGKLYGAVSARDIADAINEAAGTSVTRYNVVLHDAFKMLGLFPVTISLHGEVKETVTLNIARSLDEAAIQKVKGHALIAGLEAPAKAAKEEAKVVADDASAEVPAVAEGEEKPAKKAKAKKSEETAEEKPAKAAKKSKKAE